MLSPFVSADPGLTAGPEDRGYWHYCAGGSCGRRVHHRPAPPVYCCTYWRSCTCPVRFHRPEYHAYICPHSLFGPLVWQNRDSQQIRRNPCHSPSAYVQVLQVFLLPFPWSQTPRDHLLWE